MNQKKFNLIRLDLPVPCGTDDVAPMLGDEDAPLPGSLEEVILLFFLGGLLEAFGLVHHYSEW